MVRKPKNLTVKTSQGDLVFSAEYCTDRVGNTERIIACRGAGGSIKLSYARKIHAWFETANRWVKGGK